MEELQADKFPLLCVAAICRPVLRNGILKIGPKGRIHEHKLREQRVSGASNRFKLLQNNYLGPF